MNWTLIQAALLAVVQGIVTLEPASSTQWIEDARLVVTYPRVLLNVIASDAVGVDDVRRTYVDAAPAGQEITQVVSGQRTFTVSMRAESDSQLPDKAARVHVEKLRLCLRRPSALAQLRVAGVAIVEMHPTATVDFDWDGRRISASVMDVVFAAVAEDSVRPEDSTTFIEHVELTTDIEGSDTQAVDEEIP